MSSTSKLSDISAPQGEMGRYRMSFTPTNSEAKYESLPAVTVAEKEPSHNQAAREFDYLDFS